MHLFWYIFISCFRKVWFSKCQYKEYYNKFFKQFRSLRKYFFIDSLNMGVLFWCQKSILIFYQCNSDVHVIIILLFFYWITNQPLPIRKNKWKRRNKNLNLNLKKVLTKIKEVNCCYCCLINPLSPDSDQDQFSPNNIHMLPREIVMRVNKMIT